MEVDGHGHKAYDDEPVDAVGNYFHRGPGALSSVDALADEYRRHNAAAVVFTIDARTGARHAPNSIEDLVAGAVRNNDVLIPFGSVDPWHERRAVHRVHELVRDFGSRASSSSPACRPSSRTIAASTRFTKRSPKPVCRRCFTPARPGSDPDCLLFGTDFPYIQMDRWRRAFDALDIDPAVVPLVYKENALRVLGITARR